MKKIVSLLILLVTLSFANSYDKALELFDKKEYNESFKLLIQAKDEGNIDSLYTLGYMYYYGYGTKKDYSVPDFKKIGEAYGIKSYSVSGIDEIEKVIKTCLQNNDCELIDIHIEGDMTTVEPRLDFNREFEDMRPYLGKEELEEQMRIK